jgi:outer membrane scaffolding protein for murein synthesis (MipA/OmpV family)
MAYGGPRFSGGESSRFLPLPVFSADYDGRYFLGSSLVSVGLGGGVRLVRGEHGSWDLGLGVGEARREKRADELAGMGDRDPDVFIGTGVRLHGGGLHASAQVATGLIRQAGAKATLAVGAGGRISDRMLAGFSLSEVWGTAQNLAWDFGITQDQAALRSQLLAGGDPRLRAGEDRAFTPKGGPKEASVTIHAVLLLPDRWQLFWVVRATALQGDARLSPLVRQDHGLSGGMGFSVRF